MQPTLKNRPFHLRYRTAFAASLYHTGYIARKPCLRPMDHLKRSMGHLNECQHAEPRESITGAYRQPERSVSLIAFLWLLRTSTFFLRALPTDRFLTLRPSLHCDHLSQAYSLCIPVTRLLNICVADVKLYHNAFSQIARLCTFSYSVGSSSTTTQA